MKKTVIVVFVMIIFSTGIALAGDLCNIASETPFMTSVKLKEFFDDNLRESSVSVEGKVTNVRPSISDSVSVNITCGNQVEVSIRTASSRAEDYKIGDIVSLRGTAYRYARRRYVNTKEIYILFYLRE